MNLVLVLPFCSKDGALAVRNLLWMEELDGKLPFDCVLSHDTETPATVVRDMTLIANRVFNKADVFWYPPAEKRHWPAGPNWAWQNVARYIEAVVKQPWLFLEADAIPLRKRWLHDIAEDYQKAGKPFSGHIVDGMGHLNGSCVYPPNVAAFSVGAFRTEETAWDVVLGADLHLREGGMSPYVHAAHTLFAHCWAINKDTGKAWNGAGEVASFRSMNDLLRLVDVTMAIFHRCKDGSLIDWLRIYHRDPSAAMVPQHTNNEPQQQHGGAQDLRRMDAVVSSTVAGNEDRSLQLSSVAVEAQDPPPPETLQAKVTHEQDRPEDQSNSVADAESQTVDGQLPGRSGAERPAGRDDATDGTVVASAAAPGPSVVVPAAPAYQGKCEIFIVTYGLPTKRVSGQIVSDFDWLTWCLRCIRRHCTGFTGVTLAIPDRDAKLLAPIANEHAQAKGGIPLKIKMFHEKVGKGFLMHEVVMASADDFVPKDTTHVLHVDADCMFKEAVTPAEYIHGDKPVYVWRSYDSLAEMRDGQRVVSDCAQWRAPTEAQLGFAVNEYTMLRHPTAFPLTFYKDYRFYLEKLHKQPFMDYMLAGRNDFPANRMDFTAMGAWAHARMRDSFEWIDISGGNHLAPKDKLKAYWSHSPITDHIKSEIETYLK